MKIYYLLALLLFNSNITLSQIKQDAGIESIDLNNEAIIETNELNELLNLSEEQKATVYEIIRGILIKNKQVKSMKLIEADKKDILQRNNKAKIDMIYDLLNGTQKPLYKKHLATQSSPEVLLER